MPEVLLFDKVVSPAELYRSCRLNPDQLYCGEKFGGLVPYKPYVLGQNPSQEALTIASTLNVATNPPNLFSIASLLGPDDSVVIAGMMKKLREYNIALAGAATSTYSARMMAFGESVKTYQDALMDYRSTVKSSEASTSIRAAAKEAAHKSFENMQNNFQQELSVLRPGKLSSKGSPLKSATRGVNLARSSRNVVKLNIHSSSQAADLVRFSRWGNVLGGGLIIIDGLKRVGDIHVSALSGEDWYREMFVQSLSMGLSLVAGDLVVKAGMVFLSVATPVGWVGLLLTGVAIAGIAAGTSMATDQFAKQKAGTLYENIMKWSTGR